MPVHCDTAADHAVVSTVAAKKHESSAAPAGHVNKHAAVQNAAPKFGVFTCFSCTGSHICN